MNMQNFIYVKRIVDVQNRKIQTKIKVDLICFPGCLVIFPHQDEAFKFNVNSFRSSARHYNIRRKNRKYKMDYCAIASGNIL